MRNSNYILVIVLVLCALSVCAQESIKGKVISINNQAIPYVNIVCLNSTYGTTSDSLGNYTLAIKSSLDQYVVSSIGFNRKAISANQLLKDSIIKLEPLVEKIHKIDVVADVCKFKNKTAGWQLKKSNYYIASLPGNHFATKIDCPKGWEGSYLESVSFLLAKIGTSHSPLRVRVHKCNSVNIPGEDLVYSNIIIRDYGSDTYEEMKLDFKAYGVKIPINGFFVSIEWLDVWNESDSGIRSFFCTKDYIKAKKDSKRRLPSPAIAMSRNRDPFSLQNFRDKQWKYMSSSCRLNISAVLRKIEN